MFKRTIYFRCRSKRKAEKLGLYFIMGDVEVLDIYHDEGRWYFETRMDVLDLAVYWTNMQIKKGVEVCYG